MKKYLIDLVVREKNLIFTAIGISMLIFVIYLLNPTKTIYSSSAKIFIKNIPQYGIISDAAGVPLVKSESGYSNPLFNFVEILTSKNISTRVFNSLKAQKSEDLKKLNIKNEDKWHEYFEQLINTKIIPSTDTLDISLKWINRETADDVLNEAIEQFKAENIRMRKSVAVKQREHLEKNLKQISDDLVEIRRQIRNYTVLNNIVDVDEEKTTLVRSRVEMERDIEMLKSRISYFNQKYSELASQVGIADVPTALRSTSIGSDPYMENLFSNLALTQQKYATLSGTFTDKYPKVVAVKHEIKTLSEIIEERKKEFFEELPVTRGIYDQPSQDIVAEMANARAEKLSLVSQLKEMQKGVQNLIKRENTLPAKIAELEVLRKQEDALKAAYNNIKSKVLDAHIKETETVNNIMVLNQPSEPTLLLSGIFFNFLGILYLGLMVGLLAAWVKDSTSKYNPSEDLMMGSLNPMRHFKKTRLTDEENLSSKKP